MAVNINHSNPDTEEAYRRRYMSPSVSCPRGTTELVEGYGDDCTGQMTAGIGIGFGVTVALVLLIFGIGFWWWSRQKNRRVFVFTGCDSFDKYLVSGGSKASSMGSYAFPAIDRSTGLGSYTYH
jgi:hypothetical protein